MSASNIRQPSTGLTAKTKFWDAVGVGLQPLLMLADAAGLLGRGAVPAPCLPVPNEPHPATPTARIDEIVKSLDAHKQQWVDTSPKQRAELLGQVLQNLMQLTPKLAKLGARYKGLYEPAEGEEM
jgi:hypothetical protein